MKTLTIIFGSKSKSSSSELLISIMTRPNLILLGVIGGMALPSESLMSYYSSLTLTLIFWIRGLL